MDKKNKFGVIYLAISYEYLVMTLNSINTLKKFDSNIPVCVLSNVLKNPPENFSNFNSKVDVWKFINSDNIDNRNIKTNIYNYTPFDKTIFIDADTIILNKINILFDILDYFDITASLNPERLKGRQALNIDLHLGGGLNYENVSTWNTGVIGFNKNKCTKRFFDSWNKNYNKFDIKYDQPSFSKTLFESDIKFLSLDNRWNRRIDEWYIDEKEIKETYILHYMFSIDRKIKKRLLEISELVGCKNEMISFLLKKRLTRFKKFNEFGIGLNIKYLIDHISTPNEIVRQFKYFLKNTYK